MCAHPQRIRANFPSPSPTPPTRECASTSKIISRSVEHALSVSEQEEDGDAGSYARTPCLDPTMTNRSARTRAWCTPYARTCTLEPAPSSPTRRHAYAYTLKEDERARGGDAENNSEEGNVLTLHPHPSPSLRARGHVDAGIMGTRSKVGGEGAGEGGAGEGGHDGESESEGEGGSAEREGIKPQIKPEASASASASLSTSIDRRTVCAAAHRNEAGICPSAWCKSARVCRIDESEEGLHSSHAAMDDAGARSSKVDTRTRGQGPAREGQRADAAGVEEWNSESDSAMWVQSDAAKDYDNESRYCSTLRYTISDGLNGRDCTALRAGNQNDLPGSSEHTISSPVLPDHSGD
ncbi:hypothetical protein B0H13DRAFT_2279657 [Mycena leptocephala]|nr:hypothetical protein B0H13DRAFT_2279657 [Mycena leptocephala]